MESVVVELPDVREAEKFYFKAMAARRTWLSQKVPGLEGSVLFTYRMGKYEVRYLLTETPNGKKYHISFTFFITHVETGINVWVMQYCGWCRQGAALKFLNECTAAAHKSGPEKKFHGGRGSVGYQSTNPDTGHSIIYALQYSGDFTKFCGSERLVCGSEKGEGPNRCLGEGTFSGEWRSLIPEEPEKK